MKTRCRYLEVRDIQICGCSCKSNRCRPASQYCLCLPFGHRGRNAEEWGCWVDGQVIAGELFLQNLPFHSAPRPDQRIHRICEEDIQRMIQQI